MLNQKPHFSIILLVIGFFFKGVAIDIQNHDSYYVIFINHIFWLLAFLSFAFWIFYSFVFKFLYSKKLIWLHVIAFILLAIAISIIPFTLESNNLSEMARVYNDIEQINTYKFIGKMPFILLNVICALGILQFSCLLHLILGLRKKITVDSHK